MLKEELLQIEFQKVFQKEKQRDLLFYAFPHNNPPTGIFFNTPTNMLSHHQLYVTHSVFHKAPEFHILRPH